MRHDESAKPSFTTRASPHIHFSATRYLQATEYNPAHRWRAEHGCCEVRLHHVLMSVLYLRANTRKRVDFPSFQEQMQAPALTNHHLARLAEYPLHFRNRVSLPECSPLMVLFCLSSVHFRHQLLALVPLYMVTYPTSNAELMHSGRSCTVRRPLA